MGGGGPLRAGGMGGAQWAGAGGVVGALAALFVVAVADPQPHEHQVAAGGHGDGQQPRAAAYGMAVEAAG